VSHHDKYDGKSSSFYIDEVENPSRSSEFVLSFVKESQDKFPEI
jgi:hypothetical protein